MKRKYWIVVVFAFLLVVVVGCSNDNNTRSDNVKAEEARDRITLKFAVSHSQTHSLYSGVYVPFMEKVTELTDGQVEFDFYPSEQLGKAADLYDLTADGVTDLSFFVTTYGPSSMPITSGLLGVPGLYSTAYGGSMALHEFVNESPALEADFLNNGVRPILSHALPPYELWTRGAEIKSPEDLKGTKVRVTGEILNKLVSEFEATPINLTAAEVYEGFERGVFDSIAMSAGTFNDYGLQELAKYGTNGVAFGGLATNIIVNEKTFQGLPENIQSVLLDVGFEVTAEYAEDFDKINSEVEGQFREEGVNVYELSPDEKAEWQKYYDEFAEKWGEEQEGYDFEQLIKTFKEKIDQFE